MDPMLRCGLAVPAGHARVCEANGLAAPGPQHTAGCAVPAIRVVVPRLFVLLLRLSG